ncbi:MAG TPA: ABC transporter permease [Candidatus Binatia bacterium]|nr:ABC transporter permease [Candidatus Binatia bacterium]
MRHLRWKIAGHALTLVVTLLAGGFLSASLARLAPGFQADERELDPHLNAESVQALRAERREQSNLLRFYALYMKRALHGDLGNSLSLGQPVASLLRDRAPLTLRLLGQGLTLAWLLTLGLALTATWSHSAAYDGLNTFFSGTFLCLPAAVLALLSVLWNVSAALAIALIVFPHTYRYVRNLLAKAYSRPHIVAARARGVNDVRILFWHALPVIAPQIIAVAGISASMAVGAAIPVETLCGLAGIGQLAWQAAMGRDLPLLVNITVLVTLITLLANSIAGVLGQSMRRHEA